MRIRARHFATGECIDLVCNAGRIAAIAPATAAPADLTASWIAPALFDLQINGCDGHSFNSEKLTPASVRHVIDVCRRHGIGGLLPTLVTNSFEALRHGFATLRRAVDQDAEVHRAVSGFHLEGPYISPDDGPRGAHPKQHVRPPNWDEFCRLQDAAGGGIRLVTLAPEHDGALEFIERLRSSGVVVALGHTGATPARIRDAIQAGARLSTHLGNGSHVMLPRHDNYLWEQLAADELWASLICDGHHLPAALVRCMLRVKTPARTILTCDASSLAGLPPGRYVEWDQEFEVQQSGKVVVAGTPYLAGSGAFTDTCIAFVLTHTETTLAEAIEMAGNRPRELLGLPTRHLAVGEPADFVFFEHGPGEPFRVVSSSEPSA